MASSDPPESQPEPASGMSKLKIGLAIAGGAIIGAPLAVAAIPATVGALGFGAGGIVAGSVAAWMMSLGGGATAAGGAGAGVGAGLGDVAAGLVCYLYCTCT